MIYLDNSATTRAFDEVTDLMSQIMKNNFGNPSSMHMAGVDAEREVKGAAATFARIMKVEEKEIFFTSGGTESDNLAIIGTALAAKRDGEHIITTKTEHPAVLEAMKHLEELGFSVTYLDVDRYGRVDKESLTDAVRDDTVLVSVMHVNNEIGSVNDIEKLASAVKEKNPSTLFHTDAVQSFGKLPVFPKRMNIDLVSVSGHKIHGPKGVGVLYVRDNVRIRPIVFGGGQQRGLRSGTENVPGIAGIGLAAKLICTKEDSEADRLYELKEYFVSRLSRLCDVTVNAIPETGDESITGAVRMTAPHIVSASFSGVRAEVLLHALEAKGIYVSSGSACSSNKPAKSATLQAIKLDEKLLDSTLRFSFSLFTTKEELDETLSVLSDELPKLRKFSRR